MITTAITPDLLRGAIELEPTPDGLLPHRLPSWARAQVTDPQLAMVESQPSGVRLVLRTSATVIELDTRPTKREYPGVPPRSDGSYDLIIDGHPAGRTSVPGGNVMIMNFTGEPPQVRPGPVGTARFDGLAGGPKAVEIWLPWDETTELIALRSDAPVEPIVDTGRPVWLHHGSSISHGSVAAGPSRTWPAVAARRTGRELINLGLGGSALLDPFVARTIRDTPADLISIKIGINLVNADLMRLRAFVAAVHGFLDTIRDGHPETPLLVVSAIHCPIHETTPGPTAPDPEAFQRGELRFLAAGDPAGVAAGQLTLSVIREQLAGIVEQRSAADPRLGYLDGLRLYGEADAAALPLADGLHPSAEAHELIGRRFAELAWR
jgi:hypothetical protein